MFIYLSNADILKKQLVDWTKLHSSSLSISIDNLRSAGLSHVKFSSDYLTELISHIEATRNDQASQLALASSALLQIAQAKLLPKNCDTQFFESDLSSLKPSTDDPGAATLTSLAAQILPSKLEVEAEAWSRFAQQLDRRESEFKERTFRPDTVTESGEVNPIETLSNASEALEALSLYSSDQFSEQATKLHSLDGFSHQLNCNTEEMNKSLKNLIGSLSCIAQEVPSRLDQVQPTYLPTGGTPSRSFIQNLSYPDRLISPIRASQVVAQFVPDNRSPSNRSITDLTADDSLLQTSYMNSEPVTPALKDRESYRFSSSMLLPTAISLQADIARRSLHLPQTEQEEEGENENKNRDSSSGLVSY
ncbi:unnamed protein product [Protopolystoma xenopodis]|uniref:Uncharacterized protein n=1 Tax=Protopolystoma xenopodis TaxID=117903 RepID=A0A3S5BPU0_9PLAT|nr:unnamed protein product [Protopolystoma xenopodis]